MRKDRQRKKICYGTGYASKPQKHIGFKIENWGNQVWYFFKTENGNNSKDPRP